MMTSGFNHEPGFLLGQWSSHKSLFKSYCNHLDISLRFENAYTKLLFPLSHLKVVDLYFQDVMNCRIEILFILSILLIILLCLLDNGYDTLLFNFLEWLDLFNYELVQETVVKTRDE
eukprot:TRINITY_DN6181_c0_g1_i3.p1 TRINITY_DN6181_c0_g1~~TRINITY_DN6181_c0_g1_i3.p1  ORF type:complete len:117 (+),score=10.26 TRINITY_DN6181_c0_g1_i3:537-887(+)